MSAVEEEAHPTATKIHYTEWETGIFDTEPWNCIEPHKVWLSQVC